MKNSDRKFVGRFGLFGVAVLLVGLLLGLTLGHEETTVADQEMLEELLSLECGDVIEMEDGTQFVVKLPRYRLDVQLLDRDLEQIAWAMQILRLNVREVKRIIRHDDPEAEEIWMRMRPMPEKKVAKIQPTE